jgi:hypothetical protein
MVPTPVTLGRFLVRFPGGDDPGHRIVHAARVAHDKDAQFPVHSKHQEPVFIR